MNWRGQQKAEPNWRSSTFWPSQNASGNLQSECINAPNSNPYFFEILVDARRKPLTQTERRDLIEKLYVTYLPAALAAYPRCSRRKVSMAADRQTEEGTSIVQPGSSWNSFRILSEGMGMVPVKSKLEASSAFKQAMALEATLPFMEAAVTGLCASYPPGCVMALCAAVRHRWLHLPKEERRSLLLTLRQLRYLEASMPALVAGALSVGSGPVLGAAAGLERKQVEAAFGQGVATLLVELQQFVAIERTLRSSGDLSPGKVDLAMSLFTAQQSQSRSTESLIVFLANKAAELRLFSMRGAQSQKERVHRAMLGTDVYAALANLLGLGSSFETNCLPFLLALAKQVVEFTPLDL
eukprot:s502_g29.t1